MNLLINDDCLNAIEYLGEKTIDVVLTSPFYNTNKKAGKKGTLNNTEIKDGYYSHVRYDNFVDNMSNDEYNDFTVKLFNELEKALKDDGVILYNISYGSENTNGMFEAIFNVISRTNFNIADCITWKKKNALPNNCSSNKLTRITEFVFVFCKKGMDKKFKSNKKVVSVRSNGQKMYENIYNFVEAKNNDGKCELNKATFSTELCYKLLDIYATEGSRVLDCFNGTGTTGVSAIKKGLEYIGIELSSAQCEYSKKRIQEETGENVKILNFDDYGFRFCPSCGLGTLHEHGLYSWDCKSCDKKFDNDYIDECEV